MASHCNDGEFGFQIAPMQQRVVDVLNACTAAQARNVAFASLAD